MAQGLLQKGGSRTALLGAALLIILLITLTNAVGEAIALSCYDAGEIPPARNAAKLIPKLPDHIWESFLRHPLLFVYGAAANLPFVATIAMARRWPAIIAAFVILIGQAAALLLGYAQGQLFSCSFSGGLDSAGIVIFQLAVMLPISLVQLTFVAVDRYWRLRTGNEG